MAGHTGGFPNLGGNGINGYPFSSVHFRYNDGEDDWLSNTLPKIKPLMPNGEYLVPDDSDSGFLTFLYDCCWEHGDLKGIKINNKIIPMASKGLDPAWPGDSDAYFYDTERESVIVITRKKMKFKKGYVL